MELIKVSISDQQGKTVSARDLHDFLESKQQFADWIKSRIEKYGLVENQDFTTFSEFYEKGRPRINYLLTLDTAKELAMVEGNEKGKIARQYFIECERRLQQPQKTLSPKELAFMVIAAEEEKERLANELAVKEQQLQLANSTITEQSEKVQYHDKVLNTTDAITTTVIAKELGMAAERLNDILHKEKVQYKSNGTWVLYADYHDKGYTTTRTHTYYDASGKQRSAVHTYWTQKGREFIHKKINLWTLK